jgi:hypothetical protein
LEKLFCISDSVIFHDGEWNSAAMNGCPQAPCTSHRTNSGFMFAMFTPTYLIKHHTVIIDQQGKFEVDDVKALRGAQQTEATEELEEFNKNAEVRKDFHVGDDEANAADDKETPSRPAKKQKSKHDTAPAEKNEEEEEQKDKETELEKEFATLQTSVGASVASTTRIESSLFSMERHGMHSREDSNPFYSIFSILEYSRRMEATNAEDDLDIEGSEREKSIEERHAMVDRDLLPVATRLRSQDPKTTKIRSRSQRR